MELKNPICQICGFFELAPVGFFVLDNSGSIRMVNSAGARLLGAERRALRNKDFIQYVFPQFEEKFLMHFRKALETGEHQYCEIGLVQPDGLFFEVRLESVAALNDSGGDSQVHMIVTGLNEAMHTDSGRDDGEAGFRALAENAKDGILIAAGKKNIVYANKRLSEITGYGKKDLVKFGLNRLIDPDELRVLSEKYRKRMTGEKLPAHYETNLVHKDGFKVPVEITTSKTVWQAKPAAVAFIRDITGRKQIEQALRESESHFNALVENSRSGIMLAVGQGRIVFANRGFSEITGYRLSELLDMSFTELVDPREHVRVKDIYQGRLAADSGPMRYETVFMHKDGRKLPVFISACGTIWKGQPAVMGICRDITAIKQLEAELMNSDNELEERVQERTAALQKSVTRLEMTLDELKLNDKKLQQEKSELEKRCQELVEARAAQSRPTRNPGRKSVAERRRIKKLVNDKIMPLIMNLQKEKSSKISRADLDLLKTYANGLSTDFSLKDSIVFDFSEAELKVAVMVKNGFTIKEIAGRLKVPPEIIKTHRENIRKKLNIQNPRANLVSHLKAKMP